MGPRMAKVRRNAKWKQSRNREATLMKVIETRDPDKLQKLIDSGYDVNQKFVNERLVTYCVGWVMHMEHFYPLHVMVQENWIEGLDILLKNGANPANFDKRLDSFRNWSSCTPTMLAASKGNLPMLKVLITRGADVNVKDPLNERTALLHAIRSSDLKSVNYLLVQGAHEQINSFAVGFENTSTATPLLCAVDQFLSDWWYVSDREQHLQVIRTLIEYGSDVNLHGNNEDEYTALQRSTFISADNSLLELLLSCCADVNKRVSYQHDAPHVYRTAMSEAVFRLNFNAVRHLIQHGCDVSTQAPHRNDGYNVLCINMVDLALFRKELPIVKLLLLAGFQATAAAASRIESLYFKMVEEVNHLRLSEDFALRNYSKRFFANSTEPKDISFENSDLLKEEDSDQDLYFGSEREQLLIWLMDFFHQPHDLRLICRTFLRRNLRLYLPSRVSQLHLPKPMEQYVLCYDLPVLSI